MKTGDKLKLSEFECADCGATINEGEYVTFGVCNNCFQKNYRERMGLPEEKKNTMENMTKEQAIKALEAGQRISHRYFEDHEWIKLINGFKYLSEDGAIHKPKVFWNTRNGKEWETDWSIFGGSVAAPKEDSEIIEDLEAKGARSFINENTALREALKELLSIVDKLYPYPSLNLDDDILKAIIERARKLILK